MFHLFFIGVALARPEKTSQAVLLSPWNDVHMQMRHALTHPIVDGDEGAFGFHALLDGAREHLHITEEGSDKLAGKVCEGFVVIFGNKQRVAGKQRPIIQERERDGIFEYHQARKLAGGDLAELARRCRSH